MTVYPAENWDTFIDVATADQSMTDLGSGDKWDSADKEVLLRKSALMIKALCDTGKKCLYAEAQIMLIQADIENDGKYLTLTIKENKYKKAKVGDLAVEYKDNSKTSALDSLPSVVKSMLKGCLKNSSEKIARGFIVA
jgi:hypothetical protein